MRLTHYLDSIIERDPAARSRLEVAFLYQGVHALVFHRLAHAFWGSGLKFIGRWISQIARLLTGIEIHPAAKVGRNFFVDHGMGVVIGETASIGSDVTLYHGVTLGGVDPANGDRGKRHPTLEDGVIVGAGAQILGPVIVGKRARIGANAVVTKDVPEGATVVGNPARSTLIDGDTYAKPFIPYGTPCEEVFDPEKQKVELLRCELDQMRKRLAKLEEAGKDDSAAKRWVSKSANGD